MTGTWLLVLALAAPPAWADDKPKQMSAYKLSQQSGGGTPSMGSKK